VLVATLLVGLASSNSAVQAARGVVLLLLLLLLLLLQSQHFLQLLQGHVAALQQFVALGCQQQGLKQIPLPSCG
jgi:hypothetical protein